MLSQVTTTYQVFFEKEKNLSGKQCLKKKSMSLLFSELRTNIDTNDETSVILEEFLCNLYGRPKLESVDKARASIFWKNYKDNKIVELCLLPPCYRNYTFHLKRTNYISYIFKHAHVLVMNIESSSLHGWDGADVQWTEDCHPPDITDILIEAEKNTEEEEESDDTNVSALNDISDDADVDVHDFD